MLKIGTENKCEQPFSGHHHILCVFANSIVCLQMGAVADSANIWNIESIKAASRSIHRGVQHAMLQKTNEAATK